MDPLPGTTENKADHHPEHARLKNHVAMMTGKLDAQIHEGGMFPLAPGWKWGDLAAASAAAIVSVPRTAID